LKQWELREKRMFGRLSLPVALGLALVLSACGGAKQESSGAGAASPAGSPQGSAKTEASLSGEIRIDGSSTVFPVTQAAAEEFMKKHPGVNITVAESGSSAGFKKIGNLEIDIADASRPAKPEELEAVKAKGDELIELPIAYDGLTVVVNKKNTWATEMTVEELKKIWEPDSKVRKWSDVRAGWPDQEIKLYGPGTQSGTFDYFTEVVVGKAKASRTDYVGSEDDNVLVKGVAGDEYALGYFGFAYYVENKDKLTAVKIKEKPDSPAVEPTHDTILNGTYKPLSRTIFVYARKNLLSQPHYKAFLEFLNGPEGRKIVEEVGYVKLPDDQYQKNLEKLK